MKKIIMEASKLINSLLYSPNSNSIEMKDGRELIGAKKKTCK